MRTMKRTIWALCGVMWMSIPGYSTGDVRYDEPQEKETSFKEIPNPEKAARKRVDELDKVLHLSKKQYKKIYKLLLKEERDRLEQGIGYMSMRTERPLPPMGGGYPPAGGGHPGGFGEGFKGERPPMPPPTGDEERAEKEAERIKKRTKKMRKILTDEQYDIWLTLKPEPPVREKKPLDLPPGEDDTLSFHPDSPKTCCE